MICSITKLPLYIYDLRLTLRYHSLNFKCSKLFGHPSALLPSAMLRTGGTGFGFWFTPLDTELSNGVNLILFRASYLEFRIYFFGPARNYLRI